MHGVLQRRCFVVAVSERAEIFSLGARGGTGPDAEAPVWRRLHVLVVRDMREDPMSRVLPRPANEQAVQEPCGALASVGDDEPTGDSEHVRKRGFAGNIVHAAEIAVRNTGAREVVFVAPPSMLELLRRSGEALHRLGVHRVEVPMPPAGRAVTSRAWSAFGR